MLSAFAARPILELKQRDKSKIECVQLYGDRLLVGLHSGALRIYRVNETSSPEEEAQKGRPQTASKAVELLREQEKFSRYKIDQLAVIREANALVSLSGGLISLHDLTSFELQDPLAKSKGAASFAVTSGVVRDESSDASEIVSRLASAVKRKLLVWTWRDGVLSEDVREISLSTTIRTMTWITGTRLVVGLATNYVLVDVESWQVTDIVGPGAIGGSVGQDAGRFSGVGVSSLMGGLGPMPLSTGLGDGQALLAKDINTHFIDTDGKALGRRQIPWPQAPDAVGYSYPYLLALQTGKSTLEVRNPDTLSTLQSLSLQGAKTIHVPRPGAGPGTGFLVSSERCVWRLNALDYDSQVDSLLEAEKYDEAISLLEMLEDDLLQDKPARLRDAKMRKAESLFYRRRFRHAFDLFIEVHAPPRRVINLFPAPIAFDGSARPATSGLERAQRSVEDTAEPGSVSREDTDEGKSIMTAADTASITGSLKNSKSQLLGKDQPLDGKMLKEAAKELNAFLVDTRTRIQRVIDFDGKLKDAKAYSELQEESRAIIAELDFRPEPDDGDLAVDNLRGTAKLVDSTLFRSYMFAQPTLAGPLFRLPNFIDADVAEEKLLETRRYNDLIDFFNGKGLHEKALMLLEKFGKGEKMGEDVPEDLRGPKRMVRYLQNVPPEHIDLILKFVDWPLKTDPDFAMEVFTADTANAEHLPRQKVLEYLEGFDAKLAGRYLEYVIVEYDEIDPDLHYKLIKLYLKALADATKAEKEQQRERLLHFLRTSKHYEAWRVIRELGKDNADLYEARAIVLGGMNEHKQALEIYVFDMADFGKAEDYCNRVWVEQHQEKPSSGASPGKSGASASAADEPEMEKATVYHILLSLYLKPRSPRTQQLEPALDLLARHGSRLPASSTLSLLPESLTVEKLEAYFRGRIRAANAVYNQARIAQSLRKVVDLDADEALRLADPAGRNRSAVVTEGRVCGVCHMRFGGSVIKILPDNKVVHYGCAAR